MTYCECPVEQGYRVCVPVNSSLLKEIEAKAEFVKVVLFVIQPFTLHKRKSNCSLRFKAIFSVEQGNSVCVPLNSSHVIESRDNS